jgi:diguanylate cyclase (GGDEF)-like protein
MRRDPDPPPAREPRLRPLRLPARWSAGTLVVPGDRRTRRLAALTAVLLAAALFTGHALSPLMPVLAAALVLLIRYADHPAWLAAPALASALLLAAAALTGEVDGAELASSLLLVAASAPGLAWRREARRSEARMLQLDELMARAQRDSGAAQNAAEQAAAELADLEVALGAVAARVNARAVVLWEVDAYQGEARPRVGSPARPQVRVRLSGDPLGWAWEQDMRLRLEQTPRWAEPGLRVVAERLRRFEDRGELLTFAFDPPDLPQNDLVFEEAAVYLRGLLSLQEARALAAADGRRLATLIHGLRRMPGELALKTLATDLCHTAMSLTDGTGAVIGIWAGDEGRVLAAAGTDGGPKAGDSFEAPGSELGLAMRADSLIVRDAERWNIGRTSVASPDERWLSRPRALAALPLHGATGAIGVLAVWTSRAPALDEHAVELLHALSPYAALHLEHAREYGELRDYADRDPLTQLPNRRAFDKALALEAGRMERYGHPLALMVLDLDHFKAVNDRHGHEAGDEVLRRAARTIAASVRDVDIAARMGGEEFVVLLPETSLAAAAEAAERVRSAIAALPVEWNGTTIPVRVSVGVSACPERVSSTTDLVGSADAALYQAKAGGRNRVVTAPALRPHT